METSIDGVSLISQSYDMPRLITIAARVCYSNLELDELLKGASDEGLVGRIVDMGHLSVVEHGVMTFKVDKAFKDEVFKILIDKPFIKVSDKTGYLIVSINLRTMLELLSECPDLKLIKALKSFLPSFLAEKPNT